MGRPYRENLELDRYAPENSQEGAWVRLELTRPLSWKRTHILIGLCDASFVVNIITPFLSTAKTI